MTSRLVVLGIVALISGGVCGWLGDRVGKSFWGWFARGAILPPFALPMAVSLNVQASSFGRRQRAAVLAYMAGGRIVAEFVEIESGRNAGRPALAQALASARLNRVPLVVATVSRLTRSLGFLTRLIEGGTDVRFCDLPQIEGPTGRFMLQQMAAVAELEAGLISSRTRAALQAARARGTVLGGLSGRLTRQRRQGGCYGREARTERRPAGRPQAGDRGAPGCRRVVTEADRS